jgi:hypothetical protein
MGVTSGLCRALTAACMAAGLVLVGTGCGLLFEGPAPSTPRSTGTSQVASGEEPVELTAPDSVGAERVGLGTLRQHEVSVYLRRGDLQLRVTPLDEGVIHVTAPDTYERLAALRTGHQRIFRERTGSAVAFQLFLVAVHSEPTRVSFEPEDLTLVSRGLRYRPVEIRAVTPRWSRQQVGPRETLMAVYAFPADVDLEGALEVEYQEVRDRSWERILTQVQAERFRIRARVEGRTPPPPSFP